MHRHRIEKQIRRLQYRLPESPLKMSGVCAQQFITQMTESGLFCMPGACFDSSSTLYWQIESHKGIPLLKSLNARPFGTYQ